MDSSLRILLLEYSDKDAELIDRMLSKEGLSFTSKVVETRTEFEEALRDFQPEVVLSDHTTPELDSGEALDLFKHYKLRRNPVAVFLVMTGKYSEDFAVKLMKEGADDYILKDRLARLPSAIMGALEKNQLAEEKRKVEEEKLQLQDILQRSLSEIFIFCSDTLKFKYANEEALRNLNFRLDEITELTPADLIEGVREEDLRKILSKMNPGKRGRIFESYAIRKDKSRFPAQIHLQLIEEHAGKKTFLANVLDISDIRAQEQQKELALFVQMTFNRNKGLEVSLKIVLEGFCRRHNLAAADLFALNFERTRLNRYAFFSETDALSEDLGGFLSRTSFKGKDYIYYQDPLSNLPKDLFIGNPFRAIKSFSIGLAGETIAVINFYSNEDLLEKDFIHLGEGLRNQIANNLERKRTESELTKIFEQSPDILSIAGKDGYFKKINPSFSKILGFSTEQILKTPFVNLIHPEDVYVVEDWERKVNEDQILYYETRYQTREGDYKWIAWSVTNFLDEDLSFAVGKDISAFKENLEALELQNRKLAEIAWEQSHVVRAPLARLMGCIQHLEASDEHREMLLTNIKSSANELDEIIKNIVSRSELIKNT